MKSFGTAILIQMVLIVFVVTRIPQHPATAQTSAHLTRMRSASGPLQEASAISGAAIAENVELVGHIGGTVSAVALQGDYAYVGEGPRLTILNVSDPNSPTVIGKSPILRGALSDVSVAGNYAYVTVALHGLSIIDISAASNPTEVGSYDALSKPLGVAIAGNYAFVADGNSGLSIIDISDPSSPTEVGSYDTLGNALGVAISGTYAYIADDDEGLRIIDISTVSSPVEVGFFQRPGHRVSNVAKFGDYVLADDDNGVHIINVVDPSAPNEVGIYQRRGDYGIVVDGNQAVVAGSSGVAIVDLTDPTHPTELAFFDTPDVPIDLYVVPDFVYVAARDHGLRIIDIADASSPTEVSSYEVPADPEHVSVVGQHAFVLDFYDSMFYSVDIANEALPQAVGNYHLYGNSYGLAVSGRYAYVAAGPGGLQIIDVINPSTPSTAGAYYGTLYNSFGVAVSEQYAYVADWNDGLSIIDITDPANPIEIGNYRYIQGDPLDVVVSGRYAYVASLAGGLSIIDIGNPTSPAEVGFIPAIDRPLQVAVNGDFAYVAERNAGLRIVNIADPTNPIEVSTFNTAGSTLGVAIAGNYAYIADGIGGLLVVDISNPAIPKQVGQFAPFLSNVHPIVDGGAHKVEVVGDTIFVAFGVDGLFLLRFKESEKLESISGSIQTQTGLPLAGAEVCTQYNDCATSNDLGEYAIVNLPANSYSVSARKSGYAFAPLSRQVILPPAAYDINFAATSVTGTVPEPIIDKASRMVLAADDELANISVNTQSVIDEMNYFGAAVPAKTAELTFTILRGVIDVYDGATAPGAGELPGQIAFPGFSRWAGQWLNSAAWASPFACKLSNAFVNDATNAAFSDQEAYRRLTRLAFRSGIYSLAAYKDNTCLQDLNEDFLLDGIYLSQLLGAHLGPPFLQTPIGQQINDASNTLQQQLFAVQSATVAPMSQTLIDDYLYDLDTREQASHVYGDQVLAAMDTLEAIHEANEAEPLGGDVLQIALRTFPKFGAEYLFDGPGRAAVQGSLAVFDSYMTTNALIESVEMLFLARSTLLKTAPEAIGEIFNNTSKGLQDIVVGLAPQTPRGEIISVEHHSVGNYLGLNIGWQEDESYSRVQVTNTGAYPADFFVIGSYTAETTRLDVPWANLWLRSTSDPFHLDPGQTVTLRLEYKMLDQGYSPREERTFGNVPASTILVNLMAVNNNGIFHLDTHIDTWAPTRLQSSNAATLTFVESSEADNIPIIEDPLVSTVESELGRDYQTGYIWVNNPFSVTTSINISQSLPANAVILDSGGATINGNNLTWSDSVAPLATAFFSYTMDIDSSPGTIHTIEPPILQLPDLAGNMITVTGDSKSIALPWPVSFLRNTPDWIPPYSTTTIPIDVVNHSQDNIDLTFQMDTLTAQGGHLASASWNVAVGAESVQSLVYDWPSNLSIGDYILRGTYQIDGNNIVVFEDPVTVGAPPPPDEDEIDAAQGVDFIPFDDLVDTRSATTAVDDPTLPCGPFNQGHGSVWYSITPERGSLLTADTFGSDYDTVLTVWEGSRGNLSEVVCDDNSDSLQSQVINVSLVGGVTYFIEVAGYGNNSGNLLLHFDLLPDSPFADCVQNTGNYASVIVPQTVSIVGDYSFEIGDEIAFYKTNRCTCVGHGSWTGGSLDLKAWGDDVFTEEVDGLLNGEPINIQIWDRSEDVVFDYVHAQYAEGDGYYFENSNHEISQFDVDPGVFQDINLVKGWNMISSFVIPQDPTLVTLMAGIENDMILMKNNLGQVYWPELNINSIGNWNVRNGYQIYVKNPAILTILGQEADPTQTLFDLPSSWSMVSYLRNSCMSVEQSLISINNELVIGKDGFGRIYWPDYGLNQIEDMKPGEGYQLYLDNFGSLVYPSN